MKITIYGTTDIACLIASALHVRYSITIIDDMKSLPRRFDKLNINFISILWEDLKFCRFCSFFVKIFGHHTESEPDI